MAFCGFLRQSTAIDILLGPFLTDSDADTPENGLTLDVELSKNGQGLANKNDGTAPVNDGGASVGAYYNCELNITDTDTVGQLTIVTHHADALPVRLDYQVMAQETYDAMFAAVINVQEAAYID